ncbi:MAG: hypothetical protein ACRYGP_29645 [Janthinobacterium lividum]
MDPTARPEGHELPTRAGTDAPRSPSQEQVRLDRRAEALRANLKRRKAQSRSRADAERAAVPD